MTIKETLKLLGLLLTSALLLTLTACGGGGGGGGEGGGGSGTSLTPVAQLVTVTFALNGSSATTVGSVDLDVTLPDGFTLATDTSGQPTASALSVLVSGATSSTNYIPETSTVNGAVVIGIIKAAGFAGNANLLKLTCVYPAGATLPTTGDFMISLIASDLNGAALSAIAETVSVSHRDAL